MLDQSQEHKVKLQSVLKGILLMLVIIIMTFHKVYKVLKYI